MTLAEAALLAGLVKSPSRLAPTRNFDGAEKRAQDRARRDGRRSASSAERTRKVALAQPPRIVAQAGTGSVNYVADWVMDVLDDVLGHVEEDIVVETTIDAGLQASAREGAGRRARRRRARSSASAKARWWR